MESRFIPDDPGWLWLKEPEVTEELYVVDEALEEGPGLTGDVVGEMLALIIASLIEVTTNSENGLHLKRGSRKVANCNISDTSLSLG